MSCNTRGKVNAIPFALDPYGNINSYVAISLIVFYLLIPMVCLVKYLYVDVLNVYRTKKGKILDEIAKEANDEDKYIKLKVENTWLKDEIEKQKQYTEMSAILTSYECMILKIFEDHQEVKAERDLFQVTLDKLEQSFHTLVLKYEHAKSIIEGLKRNELCLQEHLQRWEKEVCNVEKRQKTFREYAERQIDKANKKIKDKDFEHKQELTKLKTRVIESHLKINGLKNQVSKMSITRCMSKRSEYYFKPLVSDIL